MEFLKYNLHKLGVSDKPKTPIGQRSLTVSNTAVDDRFIKSQQMKRERVKTTRVKEFRGQLDHEILDKFSGQSATVLRNDDLLQENQHPVFQNNFTKSQSKRGRVNSLVNQKSPPKIEVQATADYIQEDVLNSNQDLERLAIEEADKKLGINPPRWKQSQVKRNQSMRSKPSERSSSKISPKHAKLPKRGIQER